MRRFVAVFIFFVSVGMYCQQAQALEADFVCHDLAHAYEGTFNWHGEKSTQRVLITISKLSVDLNGNVVAAATGEYKAAEGVAKIDVKLEISPDSLRFEMWEMDPERGAEFVSEGSHIGTISENLKAIHAVWTTKSTGKQGTLSLKAK